jgi:hypothetical protein
MSFARAGIVLLALALLIPYAGYLTDDSFIHFQFAKNIIRGEGFAFNAGEPTYGATSPLWVLLLAAAGALVPGAGGTPESTSTMPALAWIAKGWGALFTALAVFWCGRIARRLGWEPRVALLLAALAAFHPWSARWAVSGMETPLAFFLVLVALDALAGTLIDGRPAWRAGAALAAAAMARPEALLLAALAAGAVALGSAESRTDRARRAASFAAGFAIPYGLWLLAAFLLFGQLLPNTSGAKAGAWFDLERGAGTLRESIRVMLASELMPLAALVAALAFGGPERWTRLARGRRAFWAVVALWPTLLIASFALTGVQVVSRYLLAATPSILLLGAAALRPGAAAVSRGRLASVAALLFVSLHAAGGLLVAFRVSAPAAREHTAGLRASLGEIGRWARENTRPGTGFAVADIGAFGYYSDRPVLDLYGLVTPAMGPISVKAGYDRAVRELLFAPIGRPDYLVDRAREEGRLARDREPDNPYRFLFARTIPNLGITRPGSWSYSVYAIDWTVWDRTHPVLALEQPAVERRREPE